MTLPPSPAAADSAPRLSPADLADRLEELRTEMRRQHVEAGPVFGRVNPRHRRSAQNLVDYLTLRSHDIRPLQASLAELGLSSLGSSEEHVITSIERVLAVLHVLAERTTPMVTESAVGFAEGGRTLAANAEALLGRSRGGRPVPILVTMPTEAADDPGLVRDLVRRGMDCARINAAHDTPAQWTAMAAHIRAAAAAEGRECCILVDLPGPKLRTGPIVAGPRVVRIRPTRDERGCPVAAGKGQLVGFAACEGRAPGIPGIPVDQAWLAGLRPGDRVTLQDTRRDHRELRVTAAGPDGVTVEAWDTTYLETGTTVSGPHGDTTVGPLPAVALALRLDLDDVVTLTTDLRPVPATPTVDPGGVRRWRIGCTLPEAVAALRPGHRVWFDDGRIGGLVTAVRPGEADVLVMLAEAGGSKLRAEKGINVPDTDLDLPAIGPADDDLLRWIVAHADVAMLSFAERETDVTYLRERLDQLGGARLGIVLKIETAHGFNRLPELLLAGMASERIGVMVARGDLAVECGFERLAEVQEEMLWLCEAAHVPVIWATEVLDQMARVGRPSRAEVSDAAMAGWADCVMLNKGPHVGEAVTILDGILRRMSSQQYKKVALLRRLQSWSPDLA